MFEEKIADPNNADTIADIVKYLDDNKSESERGSESDNESDNKKEKKYSERGSERGSESGSKIKQTLDDPYNLKFGFSFSRKRRPHIMRMLNNKPKFPKNNLKSDKIDMPDIRKYTDIPLDPELNEETKYENYLFGNIFNAPSRKWKPSIKRNFPKNNLKSDKLDISYLNNNNMWTEPSKPLREPLKPLTHEDIDDLEYSDEDANGNSAKRDEMHYRLNKIYGNQSDKTNKDKDFNIDDYDFDTDDEDNSGAGTKDAIIKLPEIEEKQSAGSGGDGDDGDDDGNISIPLGKPKLERVKTSDDELEDLLEKEPEPETEPEIKPSQPAQPSKSQPVQPQSQEQSQEQKQEQKTVNDLADDINIANNEDPYRTPDKLEFAYMDAFFKDELDDTLDYLKIFIDNAQEIIKGVEFTPSNNKKPYLKIWLYREGINIENTGTTSKNDLLKDAATKKRTIIPYGLKSSIIKDVDANNKLIAIYIRGSAETIDEYNKHIYELQEKRKKETELQLYKARVNELQEQIDKANLELKETEEYELAKQSNNSSAELENLKKEKDSYTALVDRLTKDNEKLTKENETIIATATKRPTVALKKLEAKAKAKPGSNIKGVKDYPLLE